MEFLITWALYVSFNIFPQSLLFYDLIKLKLYNDN